MELWNFIESTPPEWFTIADIFFVAMAAFALGVMLGHMLGKR